MYHCSFRFRMSNSLVDACTALRDLASMPANGVTLSVTWLPDFCWYCLTSDWKPGSHGESLIRIEIGPTDSIAPLEPLAAGALGDEPPQASSRAAGASAPARPTSPARLTNCLRSSSLS